MNYIREENDIKRPGDKYIRVEPVKYEYIREYPVEYKYIRGQDNPPRSKYIVQCGNQLESEDVESAEIGESMGNTRTK